MGTTNAKIPGPVGAAVKFRPQTADRPDVTVDRTDVTVDRTR